MRLVICSKGLMYLGFWVGCGLGSLRVFGVFALCGMLSGNMLVSSRLCSSSLFLGLNSSPSFLHCVVVALWGFPLSIDGVCLPFIFYSGQFGVYYVVDFGS